MNSVLLYTSTIALGNTYLESPCSFLSSPETYYVIFGAVNDYRFICPAVFNSDNSYSFINES